jgi:hypothetical protein
MRHDDSRFIHVGLAAVLLPLALIAIVGCDQFAPQPTAPTQSSAAGSAVPASHTHVVTVTGRVIDTNGQPLSAGSVSTLSSGTFFASGTLDVTGAFAVPVRVMDSLVNGAVPLQANVIDFEGAFGYLRIVDQQADLTPLLFRLQPKSSVEQGATVAGDLAAKDPLWTQPQSSISCPCQRIHVYPSLDNLQGLRLSLRSTGSTMLRFAVTATSKPDAGYDDADDVFFAGASEPALNKDSVESVLVIPSGYVYDVFAYVGLPKGSPPLTAPVHFEFSAAKP